MLPLCALLCACRSDRLPEVRCLPERMQRGMSFVHSWEERGARGYGTAASQASLKELQDLSVSWISLMPFGFMRALSSDTVRLVADQPGGESDERIRREIAAAHALGMKVLLKPHLWISNGAWTGQIAPGDAAAWARFWQSYRLFILHYARLARDTGTDLLALGVELPSMTSRLDREWRQLIAEVRALYPGPLTYCANWDEVERVAFWDLLDYIGVQFYAPLSTSLGERTLAMQQRLLSHLAPLGEVSRRTRRPLLFTEVGYKAVRGTALQPHLWPEHLRKQEPVDLMAQATAYRVFLSTIRDLDYVAGLYPWKWFSDPGTKEEGPEGFSPRNKPAQMVLRAAYAHCSP
jgi:hypothetical protein